MTFVLQDIIQDVHSKYTDITGTTIDVELGNLAKAQNSDTNRIVWTLTGGTFGPSTKIGGPDASAYQGLANFYVWLWFDDLEQCWNAMANIMAAARRTVYGPNLVVANFAVPTQLEGRNMEKGEVIILTLSLSIPLRVDGTLMAVEVPLESHQSTVTEDAGDLVAFETAIVTGP